MSKTIQCTSLSECRDVLTTYAFDHPAREPHLPGVFASYYPWRFAATLNL